MDCAVRTWIELLRRSGMVQAHREERSRVRVDSAIEEAGCKEVTSDLVDEIASYLTGGEPYAVVVEQEADFTGSEGERLLQIT